MKGSAALCAIFLASAINASPLSRDYSPLPDVVEDVKVEDPSHRWAMIPDGDGKMHLIDLNPYQSDIEPFFNANNDVIFSLFTRRNPTSGQRLSIDVQAIRNTNWNSGVPTRFIIHGWNNDGNSAVNTAIRAAYLSRADFNVVVVDWGAGANTINYATARGRINSVADVTARLVQLLVANGLSNRNNVLIAGHSLGGHIAGLTGKRITGGRIQSVIALDPAGPLFHMNSPNERVASSDANYVEVMHTNSWTLGFGEPLGQADFFPNYGRSQPGCGVDLTGACAHGRAPTFFAESVTNNRFIAQRCASFDEVNNGRCTVQSTGHRMGGEPANRGLVGFFYLVTNSNAPFGRG